MSTRFIVSERSDAYGGIVFDAETVEDAARRAHDVAVALGVTVTLRARTYDRDQGRHFVSIVGTYSHRA